MSMNLNSGGNGLFDIQGKALHAIDVLNRARLTTVPSTVEDTIDTLNLVTPIPLSYETAGANLPNSITSWQSSGSGLAQTLSSFCQDILLAFVAEDNGDSIDTSLTGALNYLIDQMVVDTAYVAPNVVAATLTAGVSNVGDTVVCWTLAGGAGEQRQNAYAETITMTVGSNPSATAPSITCIGESKVDLLSQDWPAGSGTNRTITATNPASSLVANGTFQTSTYTNVPDGWIVAVGTPTTHFILTPPEQQTVAISGTPTGGTYILLYTDRASRVWNTAAIAYNATASTVQAALRLIPDLAAVTVTATGTSPDWTHTVVFTGVGGDITQLTSIKLLTGGAPAITHATTVAGNANDYRGVSLNLIGDSTTLTALYAPLTSLSRSTVYFAHLRLRRSGTCTAATAKVSIAQYIGGAVLDDDGGTANELDINLETLSDAAYTSFWFSFRLPATASTPAYLRFAITAALPTGGDCYIGEVAVFAGTEMYAGGPYVAAVSGRDAAAAGDYWTLATTNSRAGLWQSWYDRTMAMADKNLLLPTTGSSLISSTVLYPA
jgi:hypothetical protein